MKKIISLIALLLCTATLFTACQKVPVEPHDTDSSTTHATSTVDPSGNRKEYPFMDLFSAQLDQYITIGDHKTIKLEMNVGVSDDALATMIKEKLLPVAIDNDMYKLITDRKTQKGDTLDINYIGKKDGIAFQGGTANNQHITLSDSTGYISGFDKDLYGIMPGTTVSTTVTFPENYGSTELAGKEAVFEIKVNGICDLDLTDENIKALTEEEYSTYEELKNDYRDNTVISNINDLFEKITLELKKVSNVVLIPEDQVNYYYYDLKYSHEDVYKANSSILATYYGITSLDQYLAYIGVTDKDMKDQAELSALDDLLLIAAAKKLNCVITDEEFAIQAPQLAKQTGFESSEKLIERYGTAFIKTYLTKQKVLEKLADEIQLTSDYDTYKHLLDNLEN